MIENGMALVTIIYPPLALFTGEMMWYGEGGARKSINRTMADRERIQQVAEAAMGCWDPPT